MNLYLSYGDLMARIELPEGATPEVQVQAKRAVATALTAPPGDKARRSASLRLALRPLGAQAFFGSHLYYHDVPPERIEPASSYAG